MVTRARDGIFQPNPRYANLQAIVVSPIPTSVRAALRDPNWRTAMQNEYDALMANSTWSFVPHPPGTNIVMGKWVFRFSRLIIDLFPPAVIRGRCSDQLGRHCLLPYLWGVGTRAMGRIALMYRSATPFS